MENLEAAVKDYREGNGSLRQIAEKWAVSVSTLYRRSGRHKRKPNLHEMNLNSFVPIQHHNKGMKINKWTENDMKEAINDMRNKIGSLRNIADKWGVPKTMLQRRVRGKVEGWKHNSGRKPLFSKEFEKELSETLLKMSSRGFPLRRN